MLSSDRVRRMSADIDEERLRLGPEAWALVLEANSRYQEEDPGGRKDSTRWGEHFRRTFLDTLGPPGERTLELCCGAGFVGLSTGHAAAGPGGVHCDLSPRQLRAYQRACAEDGLPARRLLLADVLRLPFPTGCFDLVYGNSFLHHLPDVGAALREFARVLRPGGAFLVFHEPTLTAPYLEGFPRGLVYGFGSESLTDLWWISPDTLEGLAAEAGLEVERLWHRNLAFTPVWATLATLSRKTGVPLPDAFLHGCLRAGAWVDGLLPRRLRRRYAPSLGMLARKAPLSAATAPT